MTLDNAAHTTHPYAEYLGLQVWASLYEALILFEGVYTEIHDRKIKLPLREGYA